MTEKEIEDFEIVKPLSSKKQEIRATGVCGKCNKRYTDVPVIDKVAQCPNCIE